MSVTYCYLGNVKLLMILLIPYNMRVKKNTTNLKVHLEKPYMKSYNNIKNYLTNNINHLVHVVLCLLVLI